MIANQIKEECFFEMTNHKICYVPDTFLPVARQEKFNFISCRLQDQAQRQLKKGGKFEDLSAGDCRPSALVERYDNLYTQTRLDAMDELDEIESLDKLDDNGDIKNKILFSVVVVSEEILGFRWLPTTKYLTEVSRIFPVEFENIL